MSDASGRMTCIARIFSRPELLCFVAALEAEGILACVVGDHYGRISQNLVLMRGYSVEVPDFQLDQAILLIAELRLKTEPAPLASSLTRKIRHLTGMLLGIGGFHAALSLAVLPVEGRFLALFSFLNPIALPYPVRMPGDYRSRSGKLMQLA